MLATASGDALVRLFIPLLNGSSSLIAELLLLDMRLSSKQLRQFLGHEGVTAREMPHSFNPMRLGHQYVAKLNDINTRRPWNVYQLEADEEITT